MDVFGSSPAGKLNNLIRDRNREFEKNLGLHRTLIDDNSEKIKTLTANTEDSKNKLNTQFVLMEILSKQVDTLTVSTKDLKNKTYTQGIVIDGNTKKIDDLLTKMKSLETIFTKTKSEIEHVKLALIKNYEKALASR